MSPEMAAAGRKYAQKYEVAGKQGAPRSVAAVSLSSQDIMLAGQKVWQEMLKKDEAVR